MDKQRGGRQNGRVLRWRRTIVMKGGKPYLAVGSPGGSRIIGFVAKTLVAHIDWGMDIQAAISLPNMLNRGGQYENRGKKPLRRIKR